MERERSPDSWNQDTQNVVDSNLNQRLIAEITRKVEEAVLAGEDSVTIELLDVERLIEMINLEDKGEEQGGLSDYLSLLIDYREFIERALPFLEEFRERIFQLQDDKEKAGQTAKRVAELSRLITDLKHEL